MSALLACPCRLAGAWALNVWLRGSPWRKNASGQGVGAADLFGAAVLVLWEGLVRGLEVSFVILPRAKPAIAAKIARRCRCCGRTSRRPS
jgi:NitT/TauT family transport system permease protein